MISNKNVPDRNRRESLRGVRNGCGSLVLEILSQSCRKEPHVNQSPVRVLPGESSEIVVAD